MAERDYVSGRFPTTQHSAVLAVGSDDPIERAASAERIARAYWICPTSASMPVSPPHSFGLGRCRQLPGRFGAGAAQGRPNLPKRTFCRSIDA